MKKWIAFAITLFICWGVAISPHSNAEGIVKTPQADSRELQFQDMLTLFLLPHIQQAVTDYYTKQLLTGRPQVYPYDVNVKSVERRNGFRGFLFEITLQVSPVVGPHIGVGEDLLTFEVSSSGAKLLKYEHLKTYLLPPNRRHIEIGPHPAMTALASEGVEVFDVKKGQVVRIIRNSQRIRNWVTEWLSSVSGIAGTLKMEPNDGVALKIPMTPPCKIEDNWINGMVTEVILFIDTSKTYDPTLLIFTKERPILAVYVADPHLKDFLVELQLYSPKLNLGSHAKQRQS